MLNILGNLWGVYQYFLAAWLEPPVIHPVDWFVSTSKQWDRKNRENTNIMPALRLKGLGVPKTNLDQYIGSYLLYNNSNDEQN